MTTTVEDSNKGFIWSKAWANDLLRGFLRDVLYADTWKNHPEYKVIIAKITAEDLRCHGFPWQAERILNHLHKWMARQKDLNVVVKVRIKENPELSRGSETLNVVSFTDSNSYRVLKVEKSKGKTLGSTRKNRPSLNQSCTLEESDTLLKEEEGPH